MFVSLNPLYPYSMLGLCYDKLSKVVWWFFTTLKRERRGDEVCFTNENIACVAGIFLFRAGGGRNCLPKWLLSKNVRVKISGHLKMTQFWSNDLLLARLVVTLGSILEENV